MNLEHLTRSQLKIRLFKTSLTILLPLPLLLKVVATAAATPAPAKIPSFAQLCLQKKSLPVDTRKTIDLLLKKADSQNCQKANSILKTLTTLDLSRNQITDVQPLTGLTNLTFLELSANPIDTKICPVKLSAEKCKF